MQRPQHLWLHRALLLTLVAATLSAGLLAPLPTLAAEPPQTATSAPIVAGFYVNWEETSRASLRRYADQMTHFIPEWLHLSADGRDLSDGRITEDRLDVEPFVRAHHLPILPILNNYLSDDSEAGGRWSSKGLHRLLTSPQHRTAFIAKLKAYVAAQSWQGVNIDFEQVPADDRDDLTTFMRELYAAFHPAGLLVTQDVQIDDHAFDVTQLAQANDFILPMFYDEHSDGAPDGAGSIAGIPWTARQMKKLFARAPADKIVIALGNYAYDWRKGATDAASLTYQAAITQANESRDPKDPAVAQVQIDPTSLNPYYRYYDDRGDEHTVWMMDATTAYNQWSVARRYQPRGVALWYLGAEDPGVWSVIGKDALLGDSGRAIDRGALNTMSYGSQSQVDFEGQGELLEVVGQPTDGQRTVVRDATSGMITAEHYQIYPSDYIVRRYGHQKKKIVLTFDDGPDPTYTPQVLDILAREHIKATFFVIGSAAQRYPDLVRRIWAEGHELGNHTFTHPNIAEISDERAKVEITATQRVIEALTGHTTTLFRPPYAIDVEPRTGDELRPILLASQWHFIAVGELLDPQDWNPVKIGSNGERLLRTSDDIVQSVWDDRDAGNILLLHDAGGDRTNTIAALPQIIRRFKAAGYQFTTIAGLRGLPREQLFPPVAAADTVQQTSNMLVFAASYLLQNGLTFLFILSLVLGISRQVLLAVLALVQRRREQRRNTPAHKYTPLVSVIIAAYNEEPVINRTVQSILASDYPRLEVIVVDDGSVDQTYAVVAAAFAGDARVVSLRKENGGKSSALNRGLAIANGQIIVALDADTLFAPEAITRLVRHFADPKVGAVAGNVKVGNANNLLTRWQALEYITSQNFDRRAYDLLDCITVVPGAVGAWRASAIAQVGGYTSDTLAEDTDLTWKIRRAGWHIHNDSDALAFTEAPESLRNLARQRFRWAFGTLQNLWKHRGALLHHGTFGWVALPSLWLHQIVFSAIAPVMDIAIVWALFTGNVANIAFYYGLMLGVEFVGAALALWMDGGGWRLLPWLFFQRLLYRQLMYYVVLKAIWTALIGIAVGWNKFERKGTARAEAHT